MNRYIAQMVLAVVRDYSEAISFYTGKLNFQLLEDRQRSQPKRWGKFENLYRNHGNLILPA